MVLQPELPAEPKSRPPPNCLWAVLIAHTYEVFPLICPMLGGRMHIIVLITFSADIHKILDHIGVETQAPRTTPARETPLRECEVVQETGEGVKDFLDWEMISQLAPDCPDDQRTTW